MATRSKAYPGVPLDTCVKNIKRIQRALGMAAHDREAIAHALGVAETTAIRPVAAMVHFGLLARGREGYEVTPLGRAVTDPLEGELQQALGECMHTPRLYSQLLAKLEPEGRLPERLPTILRRSFGIADNAATLAADVFIRSARYARLIDDDLCFFDQTTEEPADQPQGSSSACSVDAQAEVPSQSISALASTGSEQQEFFFRLTGGKFARLCVPADLEKLDLEIIKKQFELLELQVEAE